MQQQIISFPDGAHACSGDCYNRSSNSSQGCSRRGSRIWETVRIARTRIGAKRQLWPVHNKDPSNQGRNVQKLVRTQREIDRLPSVISAMEQSKYGEQEFIYPPGTSPFKAPSDVAEMNEALRESLEGDNVVSFTIPRVSSRRTAMNISHPASNTFFRKVTLQAQTAHLASVETLSSKQVFLQSCASLKFKQQEWRSWTAKGVTRRQRNTTRWKSVAG